MREIKFRGFNGEKWLYGDLAIDYKTKQATISDDRWWRHPVRFDTVGQYIGAPDSKDNEIYEGDIVKFGDCVAEVAYNAKFASFGLYAKGWAFMHYFGEACNADQCEVIGNIHDNPNLLEADDARD